MVAEAHGLVDVDASLKHGLSILDCFTARERSLGVREIAQAIGADESHVGALLLVLCQRGYLERNPITGRYEVGVRALELGDIYSRHSRLVEAGRPVLAGIRDDVDETAMLAIRWEDYRIDIDKAESRQELHQVVALGMRKSLYTGAGGRVLLSGLDREALERYLQRVPLTRLSPTTVVDQHTLRDAVERVRRQGFAESFSERRGGGATIGAPVRGGSGEVAAALVVSTPLYRFSRELRERIILAVLEGADQIARRYIAGPDMAGSSAGETVPAPVAMVGRDAGAA